MVHLHDTSDFLSDMRVLVTLLSTSDLPFAGLAVMSTWRFGHFTFPTIPLFGGSLCRHACTFIFGLDVLVPVMRNSSGVCKTGASVADEECSYQCVENVSLSFSQWAGLDVVEQPL